MRRFFTLDVFADTALAGNPLAVVLDCGGLDDGRMQAIAREFNLSETVFVFEPEESGQYRSRADIHPRPRIAFCRASDRRDGRPARANPGA